MTAADLVLKSLLSNSCSATKGPTTLNHGFFTLKKKDYKKDCSRSRARQREMK